MDHDPHPDASSDRTERRWWSETGSETCAVCAGSFDLEVEVRCEACDAPLCPFCAIEVEATARVVCLDCATGGS